MGDQWLRDYEKAQSKAQQLHREVSAQSCKLEARQAALLRGNVAQLRQEVATLEKSLMAMSQNTQAYSVTRKEVSRRGDLLRELTEVAESIQEMMRNSGRRRQDASQSSSAVPWRDSGRQDDAADDSNFGSGGFASSEQEIQNQDQQLDLLHGTVRTLKGIGSHISQELDLHNTLLGDLEDQTDNTTAVLKKHQVRLAKLSEQSPTCCLWVYICVMSIILAILLLFF
eukprot:TRINITY_DN17104_c0_g1_i1.p1 TRINITY_DN17104_c0_g1~~TRINITY_DN17104_c0_g1_i1.p1  ORF type:complete len:227 (-),score=55.86 TRINITY_DN17104_c0_g1_i1:124-804(-)